MWISTLEAMDRELVGARLTEILETIAVRPAVRAVILTGAGHRAFSVGSDLRQRNTTKKTGRDSARNFNDSVDDAGAGASRSSPPSRVRLRGRLRAAESTDFIIASGNADLGQPEATLGLAAGAAAGAAPRLLPPGKAMHMLMTGDRIGAQEAHRLGMVNELILKMTSSTPSSGRGGNREQLDRLWYRSRGWSAWARASQSRKPS